MKRQCIAPLWQFHDDRIFTPFRGVILGKLGTQPPCLYPNQRIQMGIEVGRPPKDLRRDLVLLQSNAGMLEDVIG